MKKYLLLLTLILALPLSACAPQARTLTIMTHDSFAASEDVIQAFQQETGIDVSFLSSGDTGTALNKAILSKEKPLADVFYGVDNTFLSRALAEDIFVTYNSPLLAAIPDKFKLDPQNQALPVDYGDVCINYAIEYFEENKLTPPQSLEDLTKPEYQGLLVVQNPATSSPGLAFLLATIGYFGPDGYLNYWKRLQTNDVLVVNDWENAYYGEFSVQGGTHPMVVSYASSPPAEVIFAEPSISEPPTAALTDNRSCFRQIEFVGILKGTTKREQAEQWIDFMLSTRFQEDMPLQMFVYPVNQEAALPPEFEEFSTLPAETSVVSPQDIAAYREQWIQEWTDAILR